MSEVDYRKHFKSKLAQLRQEKVELDNEMEKVTMILSGLDEADGIAKNRDLFSDAITGGYIPSYEKVKNNKLGRSAEQVIGDCLRSSGQMMKVSAIHGYVLQERKISPQGVIYGLNKLKEKTMAFRKGKLWGLAGLDYSATPNEQ